MVEKKESISPEQRENLIEAYRILHDSIYKRQTNAITLNAILLPASIVLIGIAVQYKDSINALYPSGIHIAGFVPLFSALLLVFATSVHYSTYKTNGICFDKIHEIEKTLGIEAHLYLYSKIRNKWWWMGRKVVLWTLLALFLFVCFIFSYLLFM